MMVGSNLNQQQIEQLVERTIEKADMDKDGFLNFEEFINATQGIDLLSKLTLCYE